MDLAEEYYKIDPTVEFAIFCGHPELKSPIQSMLKEHMNYKVVKETMAGLIEKQTLKYTQG